MTRYFLHIESASGFMEDEGGAEFADLEAARAAAIQSAREIMSEDVLKGKAPDGNKFVIVDGQGLTVMTVLFSDAIAG